jgi:quinolinate synthase
MTLAAALELTPEIRRATDHIFPKLSHVMAEPEWLQLAPLVDAINRLKCSATRSSSPTTT